MSDFRFLRKKKAEYLAELDRIFQHNERKLKYHPVDNGVIYTGFDAADNKGYVADAGDPAIPKGDGTAMFGGYLNPHWGHFILESLTRIWPAFLPEAPKFDFIVYVMDAGQEETLHPNIRKALRLTGLADKVRIITSPMRFGKVIVPDVAVYPHSHFAREAASVYDAIIRNIEKESSGASEREWPDLVYLSRGAYRKARINEPYSEWVDGFFAANGYTVLHPENLSFPELVRYIRHAGTVAALSGTLPHNLVFARENTRCVIMEKSAMINQYQTGVDRLRRLDTVMVDANAQISTVDGGTGPFIIYPNSHVVRFAGTYGMKAPVRWDASRRLRALRKFVRRRRRLYGIRTMLYDWQIPEVPVLFEAYRDSMSDFGEYLDGSTPLIAADWLSPAVMFRCLRKKILSFIHNDTSC